MQKPDPTQSVPARRFTDSVDRYATVIGPSTSIRGELTGGDSVDLAGTLEGDSRVEGHFRVREGARVSGRIEAASLLVAGEIKAPALVAEKIEVRASARVEGDLHARVIAIAEGAVFEGGVHMRGGEAGSGPTSFKEQRRRSSPDESA
jgi:cytoskeletal protein CcmA (bactofilin family)